MRLENYISLENARGYSGLFFAAGSFGIVDGDVTYSAELSPGVATYTYQNEKICLIAQFEEIGDVMIRRDRLVNCTSHALEVNSLVSRFRLDGNAYEVYTQYNSWLHESSGGWQPLVTEVRAEAVGMRTCDGATPMMGFCNLYTQRSTVFHLLPNAQWQITAKKVMKNEKEMVVVETGFSDRALRLQVAPQETIELPTVIFFSAKNRTDLDAYKLHSVLGRLYPRRQLPVFYNSWLYCFENINVDRLLQQVDTAAEMGFEAFMIDAGWFGEGNGWADQLGEWTEKQTTGPCGRLKEISDRVREKGMVFGLWFEPERAAATGRSVREHPEDYFCGEYLDFSKPEAVERILESLSRNIDRYNVGWLKLDFNGSIPTDPSHSGFYRYLQGQKHFVNELRRRYPKMYITNCASGGYRMEPAQGALFDSFWLSDNQGPLEGVRIVKDTLKRLPSAWIERWNVQTYCASLPAYGGRTVGRLLHCNDAKWDLLVGIWDSFSEEFMKGGPMGFSGDIAALPEDRKQRWTQVIREYKAEREFYRTATARILVDTDAITAIEYADEAMDTCVIQIFTRNIYANDLILYPTVHAEASYRIGEEVRPGADLMENGICIQTRRMFHCDTLRLLKKTE